MHYSKTHAYKTYTYGDNKALHSRGYFQVHLPPPTSQQQSNERAASVHRDRTKFFYLFYQRANYHPSPSIRRTTRNAFMHFISLVPDKHENTATHSDENTIALTTRMVESEHEHTFLRFTGFLDCIGLKSSGISSYYLVLTHAIHKPSSSEGGTSCSEKFRVGCQSSCPYRYHVSHMPSTLDIPTEAQPSASCCRFEALNLGVQATTERGPVVNMKSCFRFREAPPKTDERSLEPTTQSIHNHP